LSNLIYILNKVRPKHHYHYWFDSSGWALTFIRSFFRSSLSLACQLQLLSSIILLLFMTPSSHLIFGLPIYLFPSGLAKSFFLIGSSLIRVTYPVNFNLFILAFLTTSVSYIAYVAELCLLYLPFSCISPKIQGRILSNKQGDFSSLFVMTQVSDEYVRRLNMSD